MSKESIPDVWLPLVVGDYLKDTSRLTTEQHGAYLLLIMDYWVKGPPPDDDAVLASITRLPLAKWRATRRTLEPYFRVEAGVWRQKRVDQELERWAEKKRRYVERAMAGGRAKAAKSTATSTPKALLAGCTASSSTEVEAPNRASTLCGPNGSFARLDGANAPPGGAVDWAALVIANLEKQEREAGETAAL